MTQPKILHGFLNLSYETGLPCHTWSFIEDPARSKSAPKQAVQHSVEEGDALIVGIDRNHFVPLDSENILNILEFNLDPPPHLKPWREVHCNLAYDYAVNKNYATQEDEGRQVIGGRTVHGFAKGIAPQHWYELFLHNTQAILVKGFALQFPSRQKNSASNSSQAYKAA